MSERPGSALQVGTGNALEVVQNRKPDQAVTALQTRQEWSDSPSFERQQPPPTDPLDELQRTETLPEVGSVFGGNLKQ